VHAHHGFGVLTEEIRAVAPDGVRHTATVDPEVAWRARDTWGRWSVLCAGAREGVITRQCLVVDVTGAHPQRPLDIVVSARDLTTAFVGRGQALVFVTVVDGVLRDQRLDLESGAQRTLAEGDVGLHLLGDADAVLLHRRGDGSLLLVEGEREETVAESGVTDVLTLPGPVGGGRVARQRQTAVIVSSRGGGDASLSVLDLATRRVAALTDRLYFAPHVQAPFAWDDCGQPRMTRSAGGPLEVLVQDSRWLFFVEVAPPGGSSSLWVVPIDLSQPPRRLRDGFHPAYCHAPLSSPDGSLIVVDVDGIDGTTAVTIGRP